MLLAPPTYNGLLQQLTDAHVTVDTEQLRSAWTTALDAYEGHVHWTGESVMEHVLGVLKILLPYYPDEDAVIATLLHHVLHCKYWTIAELEEHYGPKIRSLVSGVHLFSHVTLRDRRSSIEDLRLMLLTVSDDVRTILIVLCDRSYLLERIEVLSHAQARRVAQDVLHLFAPVAARLGIYNLKHDLESRAFPVVYPSDAEKLAEQLERVHLQYGDCLHVAAEQVRIFLRNEGITATVEKREKQFYSIFNKMRQKSLTHVLDLYDLFALRVIVQTDAECYQVLGLLHRMGRPVTNRFKDYIAFPKPNGYQSLHTTLVQVPGMPADSLFIEIQVRTENMHREAQYGIAAHWMYKEGSSATRAVQRAQLHNVIASQQAVEEEGYPELADHIFVLSPRGDVIELPEGATPLDFAFQVHTDLGLAFRAARVNGSIVPLDYRLENGDIVEVLRHKVPQPSIQWLQLVRMGSSRSKLKRFLHAQNRPQFVLRGRELVNEELRKSRVPLLDTDLSLMRFVDGQTLSIQEREDILMKIGQGFERASSLLQRLDGLKTSPVVRSIGRALSGMVASPDARELTMEGDVPLPTKLAKCCKPHEGRASLLLGVVNRQGSVMVHRRQCKMIRSVNPERMVKVWWRAS